MAGPITEYVAWKYGHEHKFTKPFELDGERYRECVLTYNGKTSTRCGIGKKIRTTKRKAGAN
jgi:hypothetical protein